MVMARRNKRKFWYAPYIGKTASVDENGWETGESELEYGDPVEAQGNITEENRTASVEAFGTRIPYDRTIIMGVKDFPMDEYSAVWIDRSPDDGTHDYVVNRVSRYLNHVTYEVRRVEIS